MRGILLKVGFIYLLLKFVAFSVCLQFIAQTCNVISVLAFDIYVHIYIAIIISACNVQWLVFNDFCFT
jgi:hypothetical protein